jgi:hypothetical protein
MYSKKDILIYLYLTKKIDNTDLCRYINQLRINDEKLDSLNYHIERWEDISSKYFRAIESLYRYISKVYFKSSNIKYIANPDFHKDFFNETNTSQQVRDMLLELIKIKSDEKRYNDDYLYGKLSKLIMNKMKKK